MSDEVFRAVARELGDGFPPENVLYPVNARLRASYPDGLTIADIIDVFLDDSAVGVRTALTSRLRQWDAESVETWVARLFRRARNGGPGSTTCWDCRSTPTPRWMRTSLAKVGPLSLLLNSRGTPGTPPSAGASTTSIGALTSEF